MKIGAIISRIIGSARQAGSMLGAGFLACLVIIVFSPGSHMDRSLSDRLLRTGEQEAASDLLLIEISPRDIVNYGRPMLSRRNLAQLLEKLGDGGSERVLLDMHIAAESFPEDDRRLEEALAGLGPSRLGLVTAALPTDVPPTRFARHGTIVDGRLTPDTDGWHRQIGRPNRENGLNAARWLGTGDRSDDAVPIDLRIADQDFARADVTDVLQGSVPLQGRRIVVSSGTAVASTRATLPRSGSASRAVVLAMGAQSAATLYEERIAMGRIANIVLQFLAIAVGILCARHASSGGRLAILSAAALLALVLAHMSLAKHIGAPVTLVLAISCFLIMLNSTLARRFRIAGLMSNFLRGDLSPEEAWAWRASEEGKTPAVMFAADGRIKRSNETARDICELFSGELAQACLPRAGKRAGEIELQDEAGRSSWFQLDWPYDHVPIAILRDVTQVKEREAELLNQLSEDGLTGLLNRRGLDEAIAALTNDGSHYSLFYIDLNGFKEVNDTYGHDAGDQVLCHVAEVLRSKARKGDSVARLGGDEFAVLLPGRVPAKRLNAESDRLVTELSKPLRLRAVDKTVRVGAALGYASTLSMSECPADVMHRADQMMYDRKLAAKRSELVA